MNSIGSVPGPSFLILSVFRSRARGKPPDPMANDSDDRTVARSS